MLEWPNATPTTKEVYGFTWSKRLNTGEKIVTSTWEVIDGDDQLSLSNEDISEDGITTSIMITGGTKGRSYCVRNHVVTDSVPPRELDRDGRLNIR